MKEGDGKVLGYDEYKALMIKNEKPELANPFSYLMYYDCLKRDEERKEKDKAT